MKLKIQVASHWTEETDRLAAATESALQRYRRGLRGLGTGRRLVRIRLDLVNYGMLDDPAAVQECTVEIGNELAAWLEDLAAFVNRDTMCQGATIRALVCVALRLYSAQVGELGGGSKARVAGIAGKQGCDEPVTLCEQP